MTSPADPGRAEQPTPLLTYEMVTNFPTRRGNVRVVVDRDGAVRFQKNESEPAGGEAWAKPLPVEPVSRVKNAESRLFGLLERRGFFSMELLQTNETTTDGVRQSLTWNGKAGPRTVTVDRARSEGFETLRGELFRLLGLVGLA